jgi:folylpolyglutamate synthase/dihydropteroate synthase
MGKDIEGMFAEISGRFHHVFLTQSSDSSRRFPPQGLRSILALSFDELPDDQICGEDYLDTSACILPDRIDSVTFPIDIEREIKNITIVEDCKEALKQCLLIADPKDVICLTGSLYLAAELRKCFLEQH